MRIASVSISCSLKSDKMSELRRGEHHFVNPKSKSDEEVLAGEKMRQFLAIRASVDVSENVSKKMDLKWMKFGVLNGEAEKEVREFIPRMGKLPANDHDRFEAKIKFRSGNVRLFC